MSRTSFDLIVPPFSLRWFEAGEHCDDAQPGDILLINHGTPVSEAIDLGQKALSITEPDLLPFTWCTHDAFSRGDGLLSEMGFRGYERRQLLDYKHHLYAVGHFDVSDEARARALGYDDAMAGIDYGWAEYLPLILDGLTGAKFEGSWGNAVICSTHLTLVLMALGLFPDRLPGSVVPARTALWLGARH